MTQDISQTFRIAIAQLDPTVGDVAGNLALARAARREAAGKGADLVLFTELFISGYQPEDLVLKPAFLAVCLRAVEDLAAETADGGPGVIIGFPRQGEAGRHNAVAVLDGGRIIAIRDKVDLPNYGEFDEKRVFVAGPCRDRSTSGVSGSAFRSARISGASWTSARHWPKAAPKFSCAPTARPITEASWISAIRWC
jgi:predicted amidohydrolase